MGWIFVTTPKTDQPFDTPAILGGAFLASKRHLEEIDYFGIGMVGWGFENIEIALKVRRYISNNKPVVFRTYAHPNISSNLRE